MKTRWVLVFVLLWNLLAFPQADATDPVEAQKKRLREEAKNLVLEWFIRWNELDGTPESTDRFVELYHQDARHRTGPSGRQIGSDFYYGQDEIRKMAEDFSGKYSDFSYEALFRTVDERTDRCSISSTNPGGKRVLSALRPSCSAGSRVGIRAHVTWFGDSVFSRAGLEA